MVFTLHEGEEFFKILDVFGEEIILNNNNNKTGKLNPTPVRYCGLTRQVSIFTCHW